MEHERHHEHEHGQDRDGRSSTRGVRGRSGDRRGDRDRWGSARRMRGGDIRLAILQALRAAPAHGYEVMKRLEEMSGGLWRPSPGSIYPHLQLLEDEGVVRSAEHDGTRTFTLTAKGSAEAARDKELPWESNRDGGDEIRTLRFAVTQLMSAAKQLSGVGDTAQIQQGIAVIQQARKGIYQILADD